MRTLLLDTRKTGHARFFQPSRKRPVKNGSSKWLKCYHKGISHWTCTDNRRSKHWLSLWNLCIPKEQHMKNHWKNKHDFVWKLRTYDINFILITRGCPIVDLLRQPFLLNRPMSCPAAPTTSIWFPNWSPFITADFLPSACCTFNWIASRETFWTVPSFSRFEEDVKWCLASSSFFHIRCISILLIHKFVKVTVKRTKPQQTKQMRKKRSVSRTISLNNAKPFPIACVIMKFIAEPDSLFDGKPQGFCATTWMTCPRPVCFSPSWRTASP